MRSLSPSTTLVCTRTVSPTPKSTAILRYCSDSILSSNAWFIKRSFGVVEWWTGGVWGLLPIPPSLHHSLTLLFQKIRPAFYRSQPGLLGPPPGDLRMVAREQHFRHLHAAKVCGPRILRIFEQPLAERIYLGAFRVAQHTRQQPSHRVNYYHHRQRAICQHVIADRQLVLRQPPTHPFVKTFVVAGHQQQMLQPCQLPGDVLVEWPARRREQDHSRAFARQTLDRFKDRFRLQQHARSAAKRPVIYRIMAVMRIVAQIMDRQIQQPRFPRSLDYARCGRSP